MHSRRSVPPRIMAMISTTWAGPLVEGPHVQGIGDHHPFESELRPDEPVDPGLRSADRYLSAAGQGRNQLVADHQQGRSGGHTRSEWGQLDRVETLPVEVEQWQPIVGIDGCLPTPGKVLQSGQHPRFR